MPDEVEGVSPKNRAKLPFGNGQLSLSGLLRRSGTIHPLSRQCFQHIDHERHAGLTCGVAWKMARKGIEKLRCAKERRNLHGYVGTELFGRTAQLIYQCRPTVDDGDDVLEVMAHKKITISAAFERFELRGDKNWGRDELYRVAARKRHWTGGSDGERVPAIVKAQDTGL